MNKFLLIISFCFIGFVGGCASIDIPNYIQDENPYKKTFKMSYADVLEATKQSLEYAGWTIVQEADPAVYEHARIADAGIKQVLLLTNVRQLGLVVGTRYARINVYVHSAKDVSTEVEVRYVTANSVGFKTFYNYQRDEHITT